MEVKKQSLLKEVSEYSKSKNNVAKEDKEDEQRKYITCYLILVACVCFFGSSLQFGFNLSNINAPEQVSCLLFLLLFKILVLKTFQCTY